MSTNTTLTKRVAGCDLKQIVSAESIMELNNVERFMATLADKSEMSSSIKTAAAARWCSTVDGLLSEAQIDALAEACVDNTDLQSCIADMIGYFDSVTGYVQKPKGSKGKKGVRVALKKGAFAAHA